MVKRYFKRLLMKSKDFILSQVLAVRGLMQLLMKNRNTGEKWTKEEIKEIKSHLRHISKMVPIIIVFMLPGGSLLLPLLAEVIDRRKTIRRKL
jgi:cob(I)alamin adenosyltransferase